MSKLNCYVPMNLSSASLGPRLVRDLSLAVIAVPWIL